jgi:hypothetical protein
MLVLVIQFSSSKVERGIITTEVIAMRFKTLLFLVVFVLIPSAVYAADYVDGTLLHSGGQFEFARVKVVDSFNDGFMTYWVGEVRGKHDDFLYDPYNRIWVLRPITYVDAILPFGNSQIEGVRRVFGDGTEDKRFFFGNNGHTYWRFDKYRVRQGQNNRKRKIHAYSFWLDLDTGYRGPAYKYINGELYYVIEGGGHPAWNKELATPLEPAPTTQELDAEAKTAVADTAFPNWETVKDTPAVIDEKPLTDEEKTSLGSLIDEAISTKDSSSSGTNK